MIGKNLFLLHGGDSKYFKFFIYQMMKSFSFVFFLLIPSFLFALSQKECETYFKIAKDDFRTAQNYFTQANNHPTEAKIYSYNLSIHHLFKAIENVNVIINYVNSTKAHKRKPWQTEAKTASVNLQRDCITSIENLQKRLVPLNIALSLEKKQNEVDSGLLKAREKGTEIEPLSEEALIHAQNEKIYFLGVATYYLKLMLDEMNAIVDPEISQQFSNWKSKVQNTLTDIEMHENALAGNQKLKEALNLKDQIHVSSLKDIPQSHQACEKAIRLLEEAIGFFEKAPQRSNPNIFKSQINIIEETIRSYKNILETSQELQAFALKEQLEKLNNFEESLATERKKEAILNQLIGCGEGDLDRLACIREKILAFELRQVEEIAKTHTPIDNENFYRIEDKRRKDFLELCSDYTLIEANKTILNEPSSPFIVSLDAEFEKNEEGYTLFLNHFYHFYVHNNTPSTSIVANVYLEDNLIHSECIPIPKASDSDWYDYVISSGLVAIPETALTTTFGLHLHLIAVPGINEENSLILKHKAENPDYRFSFSCDGRPLYSCSLISSPPWQVEFLSKFTNNSISKPLGKISPAIDLDAIVELNALSADPILDRFLEEMKNDPFAIAQYIQNEIELVEPFLKRENSIFKAPLVYRSALSTFLEKQGSPSEQCILLVHLLRKAGFKALYAQGSPLSFPADYIERLLVTKLPGEKEVLVEYPWVLFFDGKEWITLFPWMKDIHMFEGLDLYNFMPNAYASADKWIRQYLTNDPKIMQYAKSDGDDTVAVLFVRFLEEELKNYGLSLQDVGITRNINKRQFADWKDFPRAAISQPFQVSVGLTGDVFVAFQIEIASRENPHKKIVYPATAALLLNTNPCRIDFEQKNETSHVLKFTGPENIFKEKGYSLTLDSSDQNIDVKVIVASNESKTFTITKGTAAALCFNTGGSNSKLLSFFGERFSKATEETSKLHTLLAFMGAVYFDKCCRAERILANLHKLSPSTYIHFGLSKLSPDLTQDQVIGKPNLAFPQVDMHSYYYNDQEKLNKYTFPYHQDTNLAKRQFNILKCCDISSNEHQVLHEIFHDPYAISTVKLLQIAHERHQNKGLSGQGFLAFTEKSLAEAEKTPILAQCLYFNHLKDINLSKIRFEGGEQWKAASSCLKSSQENGQQDFSYVYMTPGPISSKDGNDLKPPSYTGMGTLIIYKNGYRALISNGSNVMNGGYGSRLPTGFLESFIASDWKIIPQNNSFSLLPPSFSPIFSETNTFEKTLFTPTLESTFLDPKTYQFQTDKLSLGQTIDSKSDIRPYYKGRYNEVSDPVDIVTGAFYIDEIDLTLPGLFPLEVRRNYNNQNPLPSPLGIGWKLSLNPYLMEKEDHLFASEEDGTVIDYRFNASNVRWEVLPEDNLELSNQNKKGIGGIANPYHAYIEERDQEHILYGSDGSKKRYKNKLLQEWTDNVGNSLFFTFDNDRLIRVENSEGGFLGFCYNHEGRISEAYTRDGRRIYYTYDCQGNLITVELPNGAQITYEYDSKHQVIKESKSHGLVLENSYDELGRVIEQRSPNGILQQMVVTAKFTYGDNVNTVTDAAGSCTEYKIYQKQIYKIIDPDGHQILRSTFLDAHSWFDAESEQVIPWNEKGSYQRGLKSSQDKRGLITEYLYDERGNLTGITLKGNDFTGNGDNEFKKNMVYNEQNLCILEEMLDKKTVTTYDPIRPYLPVRIETYCGDTLTGWMAFQYNSKGQIISEDRSGAITLWEYDPQGFPIKKISKTNTEDPDVISTFKYNQQGQSIEEHSSDAIIKNEYDIMGNLLVSSIHDLSGNLISTKYRAYNLNNAPTWQMGADPHDIVQIDYNFAGLPKVKRQLLSKASINSSHTVQIQEAGSAYTLYDYDARGHLIQETDPLGQCTYREYDRLGRVAKISKMDLSTQFRYEAGGLVSETIYPNGTNVSQKYTTNGLLIKEIYPDRSEANYKYDLLGRPVLETKNGITLTIEYDDISNKIIHKKQGVVLKIEEYNIKGHLIAVTDAEGNVWKKTYDDLGRLKSDTDPEGNQTVWSYDGNSITCILPSHEKNVQRYAAGNVVESQTFDPEGNLIARILSEYSPQTSTSKEMNGDSCITTWMNTQGKPIAVEQAGIITIHHYDPLGQCVATVDGEGRTTLKHFDPLGRLSQKRLSGGSLVTYEYNANSNLTTCTLPNGVLWKASYDLMGNKLSEELQAKGQQSQQWKYAYEQGLLKEAIDPNLRKHVYSYDTFGRKTEEKVDHYRRSYTYDIRGFLIAGEQFGEDHTKVEKSYDKSGRLIAEAVYLNKQLIQNTNQSWEPSKRNLQIDDHQRSYTYLRGRLSQITTSSATLDYHYNLNGSLLSHSTQDVFVDYLYHSSGLPKNIATRIGKEQFKETMEWDRSAKMSTYQSNWKSVQEEKRFTYNSQAQLRFVNDNEYVFDFDQPGCGALTKSPEGKVPANGLDPFGKIISEFNEDKLITTSYNAVGEVISRVADRKTQNFKWDPWGNLIEVATNNYLWKASYDIFGRRLQTQYSPKIGQSQTTISFYDPENEFDEIGVRYDGKTYWKLMGKDKCEAMVDDDGNSVSLVHDALGKLVAVVNHEGSYWSQDVVTPYGPRGPPEILEPNLISFAAAHTWQGRRMDPTGLIWMGARYYDPNCGRFLSTDPIGIPISLDLYAYANGDPINFNDPDGRFSSPVYETTSPVSLPKVFNFGIYEAIKSPLNRSRLADLSDLGLPEPPNGLGIGFINGIQNSYQDFRNSLRYISELSGGGYNIQGVYGASIESPLKDLFGPVGGYLYNGYMSFAGDLTTCVLGMFRIDTGRVDLLQARWDVHFDRNPNSYYLQFFHSRAGIDVTNALLSYSEERRKRIIPIGIAPAGYVYEETCLKVKHYRVDNPNRDFVPYINWMEAERAQHTIVNLPSHPNAPWNDHGFQSPTYKQAIKDEIDNFIDQYGKQK